MVYDRITQGEKVSFIMAALSALFSPDPGPAPEVVVESDPIEIEAIYVPPGYTGPIVAIHGVTSIFQ